MGENVKLNNARYFEKNGSTAAQYNQIQNKIWNFLNKQ